MFAVARLHPDAFIPSRACEADAGYDLSSIESVEIAPGSRRLVSTGIAIQIPVDCYARVAPRSGVSTKGIDIGAGVVDASYRGEVKVLMINHGQQPYRVKAGDRIAQMIFERIYTPMKLTEVLHSELSETVRGAGGFGSTGK